MASLRIRTSIWLNLLIIVISLFLSAFTLLFGIANLINPQVSDAYLEQNTFICVGLCLLGLLFLLLAIASFRGILANKK